jgi:cytochrome c
MPLSKTWIAVAALLTLGACGKPPAAPVTSVADLPAPYNTADLENGRLQFAQCKSCHTLKAGGPNGKGPNLHGVFGRKAGSVKGFKYSEAVKNAGFSWEYQHLDGWLAKPKEYLPRTKMSFKGIPDPKNRIDVIGYLAVESAKP